jgi:hypothetical protein
MAEKLTPIQKLDLVFVGLASWAIPGGGYFLLKETNRAIIIFVTVVLTFLAGLYAGSIGVVDYVVSWPWFIAQVLTTPVVSFIGYVTAGGAYKVYGRPNEVGQIYTSVAGLLNLLCIVNAVYLAYQRETKQAGD